jgi:PAS domain S-box-containing protein
MGAAGGVEAIAVLDHEDRVLEINKSFETLFGYSQTEAKGSKINDLLAPEPYLGDAHDVSRTVVGDGQIVERGKHPRAYGEAGSL